MEFRIADTFTSSLARLTGDEQKAVKTTAFDLQLNPANPGFSFHKLDHAKDKHFWSVRVSSDIRLIVHRTESRLLLCYVDHHDKAYQWAERRKLETHPTTGAAQLVEIRERIEEITIPVFVGATVSAHAKTQLFDRYSDDELLAYGVPPEWLTDVRVADEDSLLALADHLPAEAAEALLELATGGQPSKPTPVSPGSNPFDHPDAQRRFRLMTDMEELRQALDYPWDKWTLFLHPGQRQAVEREYNGPARVSGSAGTGKTIVALHRANQLLRQKDDIRVLLTTFSEPLANALLEKLRRLLRDDPRLAERIDVLSLNAVGLRLYSMHFGKARLLDDSELRTLLCSASDAVPGHKFSLTFLLSEWRDVVDSWQLDSWDAYRDVKRLGRKTRLSEAQRQILWQIFQQVLNALQTRDVVTMASVFTQLADHFSNAKNLPFDYVVIDEAQDISVPQLRFLAAIGRTRPDSLFFAGDIGQRIFQTAFSWKTLGVDVRGRSRTLTINYRTSHQIRQLADKLLAPEISDVDGNQEQRGGTVSVFNGPEPEILEFKGVEEEISAVADWLKKQVAQGVKLNEIGVFVRSDLEVERAKLSLQAAGLPFVVLNERVLLGDDAVSISTMHFVKGLEFRAVALMACDEGVLPSSQRINDVTDESDLFEVQETERHLFYVACTRARDALFVTSGGRRSEYLDDLLEK
ncbi:3'-5' exonuclease [Chromobacterium vaccinii]|uniref:3'-5' exonuclease n=1 Tax=Chromobacterium vaccinii TaxID=1108595 RepID=UPI001E467551|nr:3'-5' exonuclease [Chromobacterium vaccinii]MCD4501986.1 UvrD-helicase domain-containing protein [Chromobacterium vaccinii]